MSTVLAIIACVSSLILLWAALDSGNPGSVFSAFGLPRIPYPKVITMMYLKVRPDWIDWLTDGVRDGLTDKG